MNRQVLGMLSVAAGVSVFTIQDVIVKKLSGAYPVHEIVVLRSLVALPILIWVTHAEQRGSLKMRRGLMHLARGLVLYVSYTSYYLAVARMPLFSPPATLDFDAVVFNTEAHPLRRTWP